MANAGSIDKSKQTAVDGYCVLDDVACGALNIADDGAVVLKEGIKQRRFTHIWCADDGYGNTILDSISGREGRE